MPPEPQALPPSAVLYQLSIGHYVSRALALAAQLGVADLLAEGPRDHHDLAAATHSHAPSLRRVLRLLASAGVFEEQDGGRFALTPIGGLLRDDVPGSMRAAVSVFAGPLVQEGWDELAYCVETGQPAFRKRDPDGDPFTAMSKDPELAATFDKAMAAFTAQIAGVVAAAYDFGAFGTIADVGGGTGALLIGILRATPGPRGIVFDQPHVVERARRHIEREGLSGRIAVAGGSFFEDAIPRGADAIVMKHVIHDWNDDEASRILRNCAAALPPDGKLLIVEGVYPPRVDASLASRGAAANDVNMLVMTGGRQRSEEEFRTLLAASGLRLVRIVQTAAAVCVIEAVRD
jgi:SAM-dependent methyltransferase